MRSTARASCVNFSSSMRYATAYVPGYLDYALTLTMIVLMAIEVLVFGGLYRAVARGTPRNSRVPAYVYLIVYQWSMVACVVALWVATKRPWSWLLLGRPHAWGFAVGLALAVAYLVFGVRQRRAILKRPGLMQRVRRQISEFEPLAPHTPRERNVWYLTAVTAGCCEEVIYRGFLLAFVASFAGIVIAAAITVVMFGFFHAYYGWKGILKTGALGLLLTLLALWSASLVPVILIHAMIDTMSGDFAYRVIAADAR